ncbi:(4Fe-4S)-binding protein [uncultured Eudoraea sp.]|uniref:(4Fe-4S)-binding protein n=1 Tax=uncultured Eudoraea sp. TaxID=1035614 RepID=UPI002639C926|nr:(4Fe-4S)-binding protein [uncultured Eudoraea sp.]
MSEREIIKEYSNGDLTVVWKPKKCIHSAICVNTLPKVYDPNKKPWIEPKNASINELKSQIDKCPSGALTYYLKGETENLVDMSDKTSVEVMANGPLLVHGALEVKDASGKSENKSGVTALCRCGASDKKPYCDGAHKKINFVG